MKQDFKPVVRNIQNDCLYEFCGGNTFKNLITEKEGFVDDETARKIFRFNLEATEMINEYPVVKKLIQSLQLRFDNNKK